MSQAIALDLPLDKIRAYCATQPIQRLSLFGSALRGELRPESDIDLLVEYLPEARIGYFRHVRHEINLQSIIGWKVDLRTPHELSRHLRQNVLENARQLYEKIA